MSAGKSSLDRISELDQLIIRREAHLSGLEELREACRKAGVKRPSLDRTIARTTAALRRLEKQRADAVDIH